MTRIIAGIVGGRQLQVPPRGTRPTSDRVREALFSRLEHRLGLAGRRVLDLYAGSGAAALEALSRGASAAVAVESNPAAARICERNAAAVNLPLVVRREKVEHYLARGCDQPFDLILADPPYDLADAELDAVIAQVAGGNFLADDGLLVVERSARSPAPSVPAGWPEPARRSYGDTALWFLGAG